MTRTTPLRGVNVEALFPELAPYPRAATRLHPRWGRPGVRDSSVGGPLLWPAHEPWPHCTDAHPRQVGCDPPPQGCVPLVSVLQLYRTHVPDLPFPPGKDLLQLLWCPLDHEPNGGPRPELHWRGGNIEGALLADPVPAAGALENYLPWPCMLHPERVVEYPNWDLPTELVEALQERFDRLEEESGLSYFYHLSVAPGIKVGGYPGWTQEPDWPVCEGCGTRMDHLLTVESAEFDGESVSAWLPVEDRPTKGTIFDLPDEQRHAIQRAADVMIGDMGGVYIFICPRCPGQPYAYRSDSS